jgi:hypothetical protein
MALDPSLVSELRGILGSLGAASGVSAVPTGPGKALEVWLQLKLASIARNTGVWTVTLRDGSDAVLSPGTPWLLRGSPQGLGPASISRPGWIHLAHTPRWGPHRPERDLELHGGLQWQGRSGALHECDISILPAMVGNAIRAAGGGYPGGLPVLGLECKEKVSPGSLDETRQMLARLFDLAVVSQSTFGGDGRIFSPAPHRGWGSRSSQYRSYFQNGLFGIVRVGPFQAGAMQLHQHYSIAGFSGIYESPSSAISDLEDALVDVLNLSLRM